MGISDTALSFQSVVSLHRVRFTVRVPLSVVSLHPELLLLVNNQATSNNPVSLPPATIETFRSLLRRKLGVVSEWRNKNGREAAYKSESFGSQLSLAVAGRGVFWRPGAVVAGWQLVVGMPPCRVAS